jgi:tetratricopeptide (TPR) repeat protein
MKNMAILRKLQIIPLALLVGFSLAVMYMGPLRRDDILTVQWAGYAGVGLLLGLWCLMRLVRKQSIAASAIDPALFGLLVAFLLATAMSVDPRRSASLAAQVAIYVLLFMMVVDLIHSGWERGAWVNALLWANGLVSLLSLLEVVFWYTTWYSLGGAAHPLPPFNYRLTSWLGHANMYAGMVVGLAPLAIAQWLHDRRILTRAGLAGWGLMALINLVFASSRGGWLVLFGTLALFGLLLAVGQMLEGQWLKKVHLPRINWKLVGILLFGVVVLAGVGFVALRMLRNPTHAPLFQSRSGYWPIAWDMFIQSPLFGKGPETYYRFWLAERPFSLYGLANNPINIYLTLAAETGLVGLGMFLLAIGLAARQVIKAFKAIPPGERLWLAACASGWVGILVHGVTEITAVLFPVILFLIVLSAILLTTGAAPVRRTPTWLPLGLLALLAAFGLYAGRAQVRFEQALQAGQSGQWHQAATLAEQAARMDPTFAFYSLQAGYARGTAALSSAGQPDLVQLKLAIQDYQAGIALEPAYALNYANLAVLYWQAGDRPTAVEQMNKAIQHDPASSVYLFNLGWMQEASGGLQAAQEMYTRALQADPSLADLPIWNTITRQASRQAFQPAAEPPAALENQIKTLSIPQLEEARLQYEQARAANPFSPGPYRGLGLVAWQSGDLASAEYYLNVSARAFGDFRDKYTRMDALLDLSDLAFSQGQTAKAAAYGLQAFTPIDHYNLSGPGSYGGSSYAAWVFHRAGFQGDVLPALVRPDMSSRLALRFIILGGYLQANSETAEACHVYRRVLQSVPDLLEAQNAVKMFCK